jgi:hypothetical protein
MDFGFGRFLEMFEERFGYRATSGLLLLIALGISAFSLGLVWNVVLEPFVELFSDDAEATGATVLFFVLVLGVGLALNEWFFKPRLTEIMREMKELKAESDRIENVLGPLAEQVQADMDMLKAHIQKLASEGHSVPAELREYLNGR